MASSRAPRSRTPATAPSGRARRPGTASRCSRAARSRSRRDARFPATRAAYRRLLAQGWIDAIRALHPDERIYTFWDYLRNAWLRDAGLRIDHLLLSESVQPRLLRGGVDRDVRGRDNASDHAPVWI